MPRLTGADKQQFIKAKIWWATGDVGVALMSAIEHANRFLSIEIREKSRNAIKGRSRSDNRPFPQDVLAKTTGQFKKNSVARPPGKPPKYYRANSVHIIAWAKNNKQKRRVSFTNPKGTRSFNYSPYIIGPMNGGGGPNPVYRAGGTTVARKLEKGGSQMRLTRKVPAIKQRGKRNATWDGDWRTEFAGFKSTPKEKRESKQLRYLMLAQKGWIPWKKGADGKRDYTATHDIPWQKTMITQRKKPYMSLANERALKKKRKILNKVKFAFPKFARRFVKFSDKKGFYI